MPPDASAVAMANALPERVVPALSATSDEPVITPVVEAPKPAEGETPPAAVVEPPKDGATPPADGAPPADAPKPDDAPQPTDEELLASDKTPAWMKARITKEANKARAAETRATAAEKLANESTANLSKALESIDSLTKVQAAKLSEEAEKQDPRPAREGFDDPTAYETALIDWAGRRAALVAKAEATKEIETKTTEEANKARQVETEKRTKETLDAFAVRKDDFIAEHPDYTDVVEREDLMISMPMTQVIVNSEDGPAIAYYLGKNQDEADRISKLPAVLAIAEMGKISARLASKPIPASKPAPITTLKTGTEAAVAKGPEDLSMDEYAARRTLQINNERRTRMGLSPLN